MCGIVGYTTVRGGSVYDDGVVVKRMLSEIEYRGPDDRGAIVGNDFALGSVRLEIVDIAGGVQPLYCPETGLAIVFNGEIFNYLDLRQGLIAKGYRFETVSEIETLKNMFLEFGPGMVEHLNGQFAIAIYVETQALLYLFRDPFGIRPLFWIQHGDTIFFGSEIKALRAAIGESLEIDRIALLQTLQFWTVVGDRTAFEAVRQVPPGHYLTASGSNVSLDRYWFYPLADNPEAQGAVDLDGYLQTFREMMSETVTRQLMADVEVGSYLSGGIDSSVLASVVSGQPHQRGFRTFSVAFDDPDYDESEAQEAVVSHLGVDHTTVHISRKDISRHFPEVVYHAETPIFRTAPVPLFILSRAVRDSNLKVVMTGEGADEILLGYDLFRETKIRRFWGRQPSDDYRGHLIRKLYGYLPQYRNKRFLQFILDFYRTDILSEDDPYYPMRVRWKNNAAAMLYLSDGMKDLDGQIDSVQELEQWLPERYAVSGDMERAQVVEIMTLLSNYLLSSQGDRMTMAHGVEGRYPYLDLKFVDFASQLPESVKLRGLKDKLILRRAYSGDLPPEITNRPKIAYQAPEMMAFVENGAMTQYVRDIFDPASLKDTGLFDPSHIQRLIAKGLNQHASARMGFRDNMAFVVALSTELLAKQFSGPLTVTNNPSPCRIIRSSRIG